MSYNKNWTNPYPNKDMFKNTLSHSKGLNKRAVDYLTLYYVHFLLQIVGEFFFLSVQNNNGTAPPVVHIQSD